MTDNEIKKALEEELKTALIINHRFEESNDTENPDDHKFIALLIDTINLINRQQAEIERLKDENLQSEYPARIRVDDFFVCANSLGEWLEFCDSLQAEAIKEFAERLKGTCYTYSDICGYKSTVIDINEIDNLVKEMVGDAE